MRKPIKLFIISFIAFLPLFVMNAQEYKDPKGDMNYYYGYAYHGNDTTYYSEILKLSKEEESEAQKLDEAWKQYVISILGVEDYTTGVVGAFESEEAALTNRKQYMEKFVNPVKVVPFTVEK